MFFHLSVAFFSLTRTKIEPLQDYLRPESCLAWENSCAVTSSKPPSELSAPARRFFMAHWLRPQGKMLRLLRLQRLQVAGDASVVCPPFPGTESMPRFNSRRLLHSPPSLSQHMSSGQKGFASPGNTRPVFPLQSTAGHVTEGNSFLFFPLRQDIRSPRWVGRPYLCEIQRGIKSDTHFKSASVYILLRLHFKETLMPLEDPAQRSKEECSKRSSVD